MSYFEDVGQLYAKVGLPHIGEGIAPHLLSYTDFKFRTAFLNEEIREMIEAHARGDLAEFADALADIVYVALGTAHLARIPFDEIWAEVARANLEKRPWQSGDPIKPRNHTSLDLTKPPGWRPPDVRGVLAQRANHLREHKG